MQLPIAYSHRTWFERVKPKPVTSGLLLVMTGRGVVMIHPVLPSPTLLDVVENMRKLFSTVLAAFCKWMAMPVTIACSSVPVRIFSLPIAGPMRGVNYMKLPETASHPLLKKGSNALANSIVLSLISEAKVRMRALLRDRNEPSRA
jgi:hypothetical protein